MSLKISYKTPCFLVDGSTKGSQLDESENGCTPNIYIFISNNQELEKDFFWIPIGEEKNGVQSSNNNRLFLVTFIYKYSSRLRFVISVLTMLVKFNNGE